MESTKKRPPYLILCLIALVAALALGITNAITAGPIEQHRMDALSAAYNAVLPAENYTEISYDAAKYKNLTGLYSAEDANGNLLGYVVSASQQGYAGPVAVTFALDAQGTVTAVKVGDNEFVETAGFGARALNEEFAAQFPGIQAVEGGAFEALSGATFTSKAVLGNTNEAMQAVAEAVFQKESAGVVFGKNEKAAAASTAQADPAALTAGARMTGSAQGFAGNVTVDFALDDSLAIEGLTVSAPDETEGLGKRAEEAEFAAQFNGKALPVSLEDIEAISGATITSTAVVDAVNAAVPSGNSGAAPVEILEEVDGHTLGAQNGSAVVSADSSYSGTLSGSFVFENGQLVSGSLATAAPETAAPEAVEEPVRMEADPNALTAKAVGFSGEDVTVSITLDEGGAVASMTVDAAAETAGLGQKAMEDAFTSQFIGKTGPFVLGENVDAITGATITSTAVVDAVNSLLPAGAAEEQPDAEPAAEAPAADALTAKATGFSGEDVTVSITLDESGAVASMTVDAAAETAGLGQKAMEEEFTSQFIGKTGPFVLGENVEAVSGATITSAVVVKAVNALLTAPAPVAEPAVEIDPDAACMEITGVTGKPVTVAVKTDDQGTVTYMVVDASSETEGLGKKTMEEAFTSQFIGKAGPFVLGENVEAVSGATVTSAAVTNAVNSLLGTFPAAVQTAESRSAADISAERLAAAVEEAPKPERVPVFEAGEHTLTVKGFNGGDIVINVTLDDQGTVTALTVDASSETEGLGQKASEEAFTSQFIGKTAPFVLGEDLDTVSGATITSAAVVNALNSLFK